MEYKLSVERHYSTVKDMRAKRNLTRMDFIIEGYTIMGDLARNGYTKTEHKLTFQIEPSHPILSDPDYRLEDNERSPGDPPTHTQDLVRRDPYAEDTEFRALELVQRLRHDPTVMLNPALSENCNTYPCKFCENENEPRITGQK